VREHVETYNSGDPIFVRDVKVPKEYVNARNVAFSRLEKNQKIKLYKKGIYYKPELTVFGEIGIDEQQVIVKKYINENDQVIGYITGPALWNALGITTQVPNRLWVATNKAKRTVEFDKFNLKLLKPKTRINVDNYRLLQLLDVIDQIDEIKDMDYTRYLEILTAMLKEFKPQQLAYLLRFTSFYNKFVRNFTGALIENTFREQTDYDQIKLFINILKSDANTGKRIKFYRNEGPLKNMREWGFNNDPA
jgi:hypothetical protein